MVSECDVSNALSLTESFGSSARAGAADRERSTAARKLKEKIGFIPPPVVSTSLLQGGLITCLSGDEPRQNAKHSQPSPQNGSFASEHFRCVTRCMNRCRSEARAGEGTASSLCST